MFAQLRIYVSRVFSRVSSGMTGVLSLPFTIAAAFVPHLPAKISLIALAALCFLYASYEIWSIEYRRAEAAERQLLQRRPRIVPEVLWRDTMRGGEILVISNVGETSALGVAIEPAQGHRLSVIFEPIQLVRPGESQAPVTVRANGSPTLREAVALRHIGAVSNSNYREGSFEVPLRLTYRDHDGNLHTDDTFAFAFTYGPSGAAIDTRMIVRQRSA